MKDNASRRQFMGRLTIGLSGVLTAFVGVPVVGYAFSPIIKPTQNVWRTMGPVQQYQVGQTVHGTYQNPGTLQWAGLTDVSGVWIRRNSDAIADFTVFSAHCAHLGCPVDWLPDANIFLCPCHGGVYYANGQRAAGPPPRGLFHLKSRVVAGELQVLTRPLPIATS